MALLPDAPTDRRQDRDSKSDKGRQIEQAGGRRDGEQERASPVATPHAIHPLNVVADLVRAP